MKALAALLSPNEEVTLRRIALSVTGAQNLRPQDVERLRAFTLIEGQGIACRLTSLGERLYRAFDHGPDRYDDSALDEVTRILRKYIKS